MLMVSSKSIRSTVFFAVAVALVASLLAQLHVSAANTFPGVNTLVNINSSGGGGQGLNVAKSYGISSDGNIVLFSSSQSDIAGSNGTTKDLLYQRNIATGVNTRVDVSASGVGGNWDVFGGAAMSESGRYVVFRAGSTNLIDGTTMPGGWIYRKDMQTGAIIALTNGDADPKSITNDGRFVLLTSFQTGTIIPGAHNGYIDVLLYDIAKSTWTLINAPASGSMQAVSSYASRSAMSCDGAYIVFSSSATNLISGYSGSGSHVFLADIRNGLTVTDVTPGDTLGSFDAYISCNGKFVIFRTSDRNFVSPTPSGLNSEAHVVEYNRITGAAAYIDSNSAGVFAKGGVPLSVADNGDAVMIVSFTQSIATYNPMYLKHISDGSGTLESIQRRSTSGYLTYVQNNGSGTYLSANSKAVVYNTHDSFELGVTPTDTCNTSTNAYNTCDVMHAKTGL